MKTSQQTLKKIGAVLVIQLAVLGIILSLAGMVLAWTYNTPVTDSLARIVAGAERVLTAADRGLTVANRGLSAALGAVNTVDGAVRSAGERIVDTNLAFAILERTVGDTLFPRVVAAQETVGAVADTVLAVNDALEAANRLPFVEAPTLTTELGLVADRLASVRARVEEIRDGLRDIKEQKVARPVTFITERTSRLSSEIDAVLTTTTSAQTRIAITLARLANLSRNLPRIIDLISLTITLIALWLLGVQGYALAGAYEYLAGKPIAWPRRGQPAAGAVAAADAEAAGATDDATEAIAAEVEAAAHDPHPDVEW